MTALLLIAGLLQTPVGPSTAGVDLGVGVVMDSPQLIARPWFGGDWDGFRLAMQAPIRFSMAKLLRVRPGHLTLFEK